MAKILIVDDEADMRFAVRMLLERTGHTVREADSGDAALKAVHEEAPDLMLLDMRLPGMDGVQILQKVREQLPDLPIIMVTGYGNVELAEQAIQLGADHYLSKPFHNKELIEVVHKTLEKRGHNLDELVTPEPKGEAAPAVQKPAAPVVSAKPARWKWAVVGVLAVGLVWKFVMPKSQYPVPYANPAALVFMDSNLWIADWFSQAIYLHEARARELVLKKTYYLPDIHLTGMAVTPNAVYTADSWAHVLRMHRMDDHLSVQFTVPSPGPAPCSLFWDGKYLWSCDLTTGKIYQHQADERLTVVASYTSPGKAPIGFYKDDKWAWSMDAKTRQLYQRRIDNQLSIVATFQLPEWQEGGSPLSSFTWRGDDLWFTRTGKGFIFRRSRGGLQASKTNPS